MPLLNKDALSNLFSTEPEVDETPQVSAVDDLDSIIQEMATKYDVDSNLVRAVIGVESGGNPRAVSGKGAKGLMQLMPETAAEMGVTDLSDKRQNIEGGTKYLAKMLKKHGGNRRLALAAYNAGPGNVAKYGGIPPFPETEQYVEKVENIYSEFGKNTESVGNLQAEEADKIQEEDSKYAASNIKDLYGEEDTKAEEGGSTGALQWVKEKGQAFAGGAVGTLEQMARGAEWMGLESAGDLADVIEEFREAHLTPEHETYMNMIASGFGSMMMFLVPGLSIARGVGLGTRALQLGLTAQKALKYAGIATSTGMEALAEAGGVYHDSLEAGKSEEEASDDARDTFIYNMALVGATNKLGGFFEHGGSFAKKLLSGAAMEGVQEGGQSVISQSKVKGEVDWRQVATEASVGAIVGGSVGGVINLIESKAGTEDDPKGYDPNKKIDLSDTKGFNTGVTADVSQESQLSTEFGKKVEASVAKADKKIAEENIAKQAAAQMKQQEDAALAQKQANDSAVAQKKEEERKFQDLIRTEAGVIHATRTISDILEQSDSEVDKSAFKVLKNAHRLAWKRDYLSPKIQDSIYDLTDVAAKHPDPKVKQVADSLSKIFTQNQANAKINEYQIKQQEEQEKLRQKEATEAQKKTAQRNIQQTDTLSRERSERTAEVATKTSEKETIRQQGERLREQYGQRRTEYTAPSPLREQTEEQKQKSREKKTAQRNIEQADQTREVTAKPKAQLNRMQLAQERLAQTKKLKEESAKRNLKQLSEPEPRFSRQTPTGNIRKSVTVANKGVEGLVKYDGKWEGVGEQFTTYKQMGKVPAGQTFIIPEGTKVTADEIRRKLNGIMDKWGEKNHFELSSGAAEKVRERRKEYYKENRESEIEKNKAYKKTLSQEKLKAYQAKYREKNREAIRKRNNEWQKENKGIKNATTRRRQLRIKNLSPESANKDQIDYLYRKAAQLSKEYDRPFHVDHIIPISKGGIHHQDNLQILEGSENNKKSKGMPKTSYWAQKAHEATVAYHEEIGSGITVPPLRKSIGTLAPTPKSSPAFHDDLTAHLNELHSLGKARGPKKLNVLKNPSEYNGRYADRLSKDDKGMIIGDTVIVFSDNVADMADGVATYLHESVGHSGLKKFCEDHQINYDELLMVVYNSVKTSKVFTELADIYSDETKNMSIRGKQLYLAEEFLAKRVERVDPFVKRKLWMRIRDFINTWLKGVWGREKIELNLKQIDFMLQAAVKYQFTGNIRDNLEFARTTEEYVKDVEYMIKNYPKALKWEENHSGLVNKHLGRDAGLFNVMLALTSPGALVKTNSKWAIETILYLHGKLPVAKSRFPNEIMKKLERMTGIVPKGKERTQASGKYYTESVKSAQYKVAEFIRALLGDVKSTVNDRWLYRLFFGPSRLTVPALDKIMSGQIGAEDMDAGWTRVENYSARHKLFEITRELNKKGYKVYPAEVQAALWVREIQVAQGTTTLNDYAEGLTSPSADLGGLTPLQYYDKMMGPMSQREFLVDKLKLGKLPERSALDIDYAKWLEKEGIKPIDIGIQIPALNPAYFADSNPKSLTIEGKEITKAEFTGGKGGDSILNKRPFAILTAENPNNTAMSEEENIKRNQKLVKRLDEMGLEYTPVEGYYNRHEDSFLVFGMDRSQAIELAKEFEQESVIHNGDLVYQDGTYQEGDLNKIDFSGKQKNFFTSVLIKGQEVKFSIPLADDRVMKIIHYSPVEGITEVDPDRMGEGQIGAEKSEIKDWETMELHEGFEKKSNWYVPKDEKNIEGHRFGTYPVYEATINVNDLYTLGKEEKPSDTELRKLGYKGWYSPSDGQVRMFEKTPVKYLGRSHITKKDFNSVTGKNYGRFITKEGLNTENLEDTEVRFSKADKVDIAVEDTLAQDQALAGLDGNVSIINKLWEYTDDSIHEGNVNIKKLEEEMYDLIGAKKGRVLGGLLGRRTMETDLTQKAIHLYLDTKSTGADLEAHYKDIQEKLKVAKGSEKLRLLSQKQIIERMAQLTPEVKAWADTKVRSAYNEMFARAAKADVVGGFIEDYARRIWKAPKGQEDVWTFWGIGNQRTLGSIVEGWQKGFDLSIEGVFPAMTEYMREMNTKIAQKTYREYGMNLKDLHNNSVFLPEGAEVSINGEKVELEKAGYRVMNANAFAVYVKKGWTWEKDGMEGVLTSNPSRGSQDRKNYRRLRLYAPKQIADALNKQFDKGNDLFTQSPALQWLLDYNSIIKGWILSASFFHYLAGWRSWIFGVQGRGSEAAGHKKILNPLKAKAAGMQKIMSLSPVIKLGVRNGLTIGAVQDFDEKAYENRKGLLQFIGDSFGSEKLTYNASKLKHLRERFTNQMFRSWFAGLKAEAFAVEFAHEMKKEQGKLLKGEITKVDENVVAERVAQLINNDFGGLHNRRMGKHPSAAKFWRLLLLAPDWTMSNFRTVGGALGIGKFNLNRYIQKATGQNVLETKEMSDLHKKFWLGALSKIIVSQVLANAMIYTLLGDDDESVAKFYKDQMSSWDQFSKLKWAYVDITPIARFFGASPDDSKGVSIGGHFFDPFKLASPDRLLKGKSSPIVKVAEQLITGTDYASRPFTEYKDLFKGEGTIAKSRHAPTPNFFKRLPSTIINTYEGMFPIPAQSAVKAFQGEEEGWASVLNSIGVHVTTLYDVSADKNEYEKIKTDINKIEKKYKDAKKAEDPEALSDAVEEIKGYKGYRTLKKLMDDTDKKIKPINGKIKLLELMKKREKGITETQQKKLDDLKSKRNTIMGKFVDVYNKYH